MATDTNYNPICCERKHSSCQRTSCDVSGKKGAMRELDRQISITIVPTPLVNSTVLPNLGSGTPSPYQSA
jgi:hypothetical protein